jgi:hypothetical protein
MKMHFAVVVLPRAANAAVRVEYSPERVPEPRTVKQPLGVLVRAVRFTRSPAGLASEVLMNRKPSTAKVWVINFMAVEYEGGVLRMYLLVDWPTKVDDLRLVINFFKDDFKEAYKAISPSFSSGKLKSVKLYRKIV